MSLLRLSPPTLAAAPPPNPTPLRSPKNSSPSITPLSRRHFSIPTRRNPLPVLRAGIANPPSPFSPALDGEILLSETFPLRRILRVDGKVVVRMDVEESERRVVVGCDLEGKWVLHWGVSYCGEIGSEWDQPPPEMRPSGSIPIKDYAIETPMKKSTATLDGGVLYEVEIKFDSNTPIVAIHFVLKEEETGAWFQHKGRDFKISLTNNVQKGSNYNGKQGLSILSGALNQISTLLLKVDDSSSQEQEFTGGINDRQESRQIAGLYEEFPISKEELVQNNMTVSVKKSNEMNKNLVQLDTDVPGDVIVHWGVCKENKNWEIPPDPHPPGTKIFRNKALQTLLQPKSDGLGSWGVFQLDKEFSGLLFALKLNEYTWLNNKGTDFYIPFLSSSSSTTQLSEDLAVLEDMKSLETQDTDVKQNEIIETKSKSSSSTSLGTEDTNEAVAYTDEIINEIRTESKSSSSTSSATEDTNEAVAYTDEIINEIRTLVTDISSERGKSAKTKGAQESILREIEKLAAEAYSIFRSSTPNIVEQADSSVEILKDGVKVSSGTGSGYEILCQGFNWESHKSGKWYTELSAKAEELSTLGFTVIWLPPPTESVSPEGYMPKDLYNLNSRYGNMEELKDLVKKLHKVGIKVLGDVVLNHRCAHFKNQNGVWNLFGGRLNWDDRAVVADDPHFQGRGNKSSGDNFHAAPNIDHSQEFVRKDLKEWLCWLRKEVGYDGWRLDFVRGFWGGYVKDYMEASEPYFAVGEYWDSLSYTYGAMDYNQDAHRQRIIDWLNATNGAAGAFDVTTKGILHTALEKCEYWRLSDENGKPPGVVGWWPSRAVTFIENHDTGSTQGHWRFPSGKEMQGYAYILTHPGTPSVFYDHIFSHYKQEISRLISLRNRKKLHCRSLVKIVKAEKDFYVAEIDEKIFVKIGPGYYEPTNGGTRQWILAAEGKDYRVWEAS